MLSINLTEQIGRGSSVDTILFALANLETGWSFASLRALTLVVNCRSRCAADSIVSCRAYATVSIKSDGGATLRFSHNLFVYKHIIIIHHVSLISLKILVLFEWCDTTA